MRVATWNVNSARARDGRLVGWLDARHPDVACLQETKMSNAEFAEVFGARLAERGYAVAHHGFGRWNGVAILSRVGLDDVRRGLTDEPGFPGPEARALAATCGGLRVWSVYVPNGRAPGDAHFTYKLAWLEALHRALHPHPVRATIVCGDFNVAPADEDVFDPAALVGSTHVTPDERRCIRMLVEAGLRDVVRARWPGKRIFTYWDYRAGMFHQDLGMRIDLALASEDVASRVRAAWVDRQARKGSAPSDHAPVIVDLDAAPDGDAGPVVPPPSSPRTRGWRPGS
jgi:exodeoxyribonuclease-3